MGLTTVQRYCSACYKQTPRDMSWA